MNLQDLSAYMTSLLRSGPEVIASFLMGVLFTGMVAFALRRWVFPGRELAIELARKDTEIARKDAELARKDAEIARVEAKSTAPERTLTEKDVLVRRLQDENAALLAASVRGVGLEAENRQLAQDKQSLEQTIKELRTELAQVSGELAHSAKWLKVFEENARLTESGSLAEG